MIFWPPHFPHRCRHGAVRLNSLLAMAVIFSLQESPTIFKPGDSMTSVKPLDLNWLVVDKTPLKNIGMMNIGMMIIIPIELGYTWTGWWKKYELVNWDDDYSQFIWKNKINVPVTTNQWSIKHAQRLHGAGIFSYKTEPKIWGKCRIL